MPADRPSSHAPPISLTACSADDLGFLYALASAAPERWYRVCRRGLPPPPVFEHALWEGVAAQFLVRGPDGRPVGVTSIHDLDLHHGVAWFDVVVDPGPGHDDAIGAISRRIVDHGFGSWNLRLLYATHLEFQTPPLAGSGLDHEEQARLRGFYWHDGLHWDRVVTAVERAAWLPSEPGG